MTRSIVNFTDSCDCLYCLDWFRWDCYTIITSIKIKNNLFITCFLVCLLWNLLLNLMKCVICMFLAPRNEEEFFFFPLDRVSLLVVTLLRTVLFVYEVKPDADIKKLLTRLWGNAAAESCKPPEASTCKSNNSPAPSLSTWRFWMLQRAVLADTPLQRCKDAGVGGGGALPVEWQTWSPSSRTRCFPTTGHRSPPWVLERRDRRSNNTIHVYI